MQNNMNYLSILAALALTSACGTHRGGASDDHLVETRESASVVTVKASELPDGITLSDESLKSDVIQILVRRGGKDPKDLWTVDLFMGDVRIIKSRTGNVVYPPGAAVEFWRKEANGTWRPLPTA
jgi:hypothetical protein